MRSRALVCGLLPLVAVFSVNAQVAAQESPEFGDTGPAEPMAYEAEDSTEMSTDTDSAPMPYEAPTEDRGYSDTAPERTPSDEVEEESLAPSVRFNAEFGFFTSSDDVGTRLSLSPILGFGLGLTDAIEFNLNWGMNFQSDGAPDNSSASTVVIGNPQLWLGHHSLNGKTHMTFGGGVTLPLASLPNDAADQAIAASAYQHAMAIRGSWNQWLWTTDHMAGFVNFNGYAIMDELLFGGEAAFGMLVPIDRVGQAAAVLQAAGEVGYATDTVRVVLRAQGVATVTPTQENPLQFALDPYVAWNVSESVTLSGRWTVNLNNPNGFDGARIWGARIGANIAL